jgi:hypothetical protein
MMLIRKYLTDRQSRRREGLFEAVYRDNAFGGDESASGPGSSLASTRHLREALPRLLAKLGCASLLDIPCGDFHWMSEVVLGAEYCGADIVTSLVERNRRLFGKEARFERLDLMDDPLPKMDAILCRDILVHLSFDEIRRALANIARSGATYLLTTTFPHLDRNDDVMSPNWRRLNLELPPFDYPPPLESIQDYDDDQVDHSGKSLGVWRIADLPHVA